MGEQQLDGDPHGECAAEIHRLEQQVVNAELCGGPSGPSERAPG